MGSPAFEGILKHTVTNLTHAISGNAGL